MGRRCKPPAATTIFSVRARLFDIVEGARRMFSTPYSTRRFLSGTFPSYYHLAMYGWFGPSGDGHVATNWGSSGGAQTAARGRTTRPAVQVADCRDNRQS